jgi:hypothetical protein
VVDRRWYEVWCVGAPLAAFLVIIVTAPSFMAPLFDGAVQIGGPPAGTVVMAGFWIVLGLVGLVAVRFAHRAGTLAGMGVGMFVLAIMAWLLSPTIILAIRNLKV